MPRDRNAWSGQTSAIHAGFNRQHVFIGLDFGTTYTKVSYSVSGPGTTTLRVRTIRFYEGADGFFLPSSVWVVPDDVRGTSFCMDAPEGKATAFPVTYFKYSMVLSGLKQPEGLNQALAGSHHGHRLLSAFFLGCVLSDIRIRILEAEHFNPSNVEWYVNMGFPAGSSASAGAAAGDVFRPERPDGDIEGVFIEVLNVAWALSSLPVAEKRTASLRDLERAYSEHQDSRDDLHLNCVPELYAEVLLYYQDRNVPEGFYCVVDVGGGTADIALFLKTIQNGSTTVKCFAHAVSPLGFESLLEKTSLIPISDTIRETLKCIHVPQQVLGHTGNMPTSQFVDSAAFEMAVHEFEEAYGRHCLDDVRLRQPAIVMDQVKNQRDLSLFLLGGGCDVRFYHDVISYMSMALQKATFPAKVEHNILDYLSGGDGSLRFEENGNNRILISQMLAQPFDLIPPLSGEKWILHSKNDPKLPHEFGVGAGTSVSHKLYGKGTIIQGAAVDPSHVLVKFDIPPDGDPEPLSFPNPSAFKQGWLSVIPS